MQTLSVRRVGAALLATGAVGAAVVTLWCWGMGVYYVWIYNEVNNYDNEGFGTFMFMLSVVPFVVTVALGAAARGLHRSQQTF